MCEDFNLDFRQGYFRNAFYVRIPAYVVAFDKKFIVLGGIDLASHAVKIHRHRK